MRIPFLCPRLPVYALTLALLMYPTTGTSGEAGASLPAHVYFFNHIHSRHSPDNKWAKPLKLKATRIVKHARDFLSERNAQGLISITDHNDDRSFDEIEAETRSGRVTALRSVEWGLPSHLTLIGLVPQWDKLARFRDYKHLAQLEAARGAATLRIINHPDYKGREWPRALWGDADAVEVWNTPYEERPFLLGKKTFSKSHNRRALAQWTQALDDWLGGGRFYPAVAGTDFHFNAPCLRERLLLYPANIVLGVDHQPGALTAAISQGRVSIVTSPESPKLFLRASADGQSADMGDTLRVSKPTAIRVTATGDFMDTRARLEPGCYESFASTMTRAYPLDRDRLELRVYQGSRPGSPVWRGSLPPNPLLSSVRLELDWGGRGRDYIRLELWRVQRDFEELAGLTNPVLILPAAH